MKHFLFVSALLIFFSGSIFSQIPQTLSYQGILTDPSGVLVPDNNYALTFKLYDTLNGGTALWEEMQVVAVSKGLFNVILGKVVPIGIPFDEKYYLGISVGVSGELTPRTEITSTAYSFISKTVPDGAITQSKLAPGVSLPPGGTAGGDLSGTYPNPVVGKLQGRTVANTAPASGQVLSWNGTQWTPVTLSSGMGGSGTAGNIPKFTASNTLGNSIISENSGKIAINKPLATYSVDIGTTALSDNFMRLTSSGRAGIFFGDAAEYSGGMFYDHSVDALQFTTTGAAYAERMRITNNGRVGIGLTVPLGLLHVKTSGRYAGYFESDSLNVNTNVIRAVYTGTGNFDAKGINVTVTPADGYGFGGQFTGGYIGLDVYGSGGAFSSNAYGLWVTANGSAGTRYGIYATTSTSGTVTKYALYANGDIAHTGSIINVSDIRLKQNISNFGNALDKIKLLQPKYYSFSKDQQYAHMNLPEGNHYGLIAQELEKVFPEMVTDAVQPSAEENRGDRGGESIHYKGVKMMEMIPVLIQAIKEQQEQIEQLTRKIEQLQNR